jgi:CMP-N-acetylneuraminic acid synthetase
MESDVLFLICARNGSKGIANKNVAEVVGKPLILHTIDQLNTFEHAHRTIVSTDGDPIESVCRSKVDLILSRPAELATDHAIRLPVVMHALAEAEKYFECRFKYILDFLVTAPCRNHQDIEAVINLLRKPGVGNVITVTPAKRNPYFNQIEFDGSCPKLVKQWEQDIPGRQMAPEVYDMNASIFGWEREHLLSAPRIHTKKTRAYIMPEERSIDVDTPMDLEFLNFIMQKKHV